MPKRPKMVKHTLKILQHLLQDFKSESDHFGMVYFDGLKTERKLLVNFSDFERILVATSIFTVGESVVLIFTKD